MGQEISRPPGRDVTHYAGQPGAPPHPGYPPTPLPDDDEIRLGELWALVSRNRWLIAGFVAVAVGLAALYNTLVTPIWEASTTIRIEEMKKNPLTSETAALMGLGGDEEIETEMEVLRSYAMAERVVDSLALQVQMADPESYTRSEIFSSIQVLPEAVPGVYVFERQGEEFILRRETGESLGRVSPESLASFDGLSFSLASTAPDHPRIRFQVLPRDQAVQALLARLSIRQVNRDVSMIQVSYEGPDRSLVAEVPNQYAELFMVQRRGEHRTEASSTVAFLREQIDSLAVELSQAEEEQREFQEAEGVVALEAEGQASILQAAALQAKRDALQAEGSSLGRLLREAERSSPTPTGPSPFRGLVAYPSLLVSAAVSGLLSNLVNLENERQELLTRRTPQDMDVRALTERIDAIENQLHTIATNYHRGVTGQVSSLESSLGREAGILSTMPRKQVEMSRRQRETELLQQVYTLLQTRLKEAEIAEAVQDPSARIVDHAAIRGGPVKPRSTRNLVLAMVLGAMLGFGAAILREARDKTIHTREDLKQLTAVPVLALIPQFEEEQKSLTRRGLRLIGKGNGKTSGGHQRRQLVAAAADQRGAVSEAFRTLRTNVTFTAADSVPRSLMVTSALPGDGKTTTSVNLAHAFAQQGLSVLLVDCDLRRGQIHSIFDVEREPGLSNVLVDSATIDGAIRPLEFEGVGLAVLSSGTLPPNPTELLTSSRMRWLLEQLEQRFDQVILDTPPVSLVADASVLAQLVDGVLVVARSGCTEEAALRYAMEQLLHVGAPVKGTILNCIDRRAGGYSGYSYGYRYSDYSSTDSL